MNRAEKTLRETGIVAIVRGIQPELAKPLAEALLAGGVRMMEVTMNTDGACDIIRDLRREYADGRMLIGAGTVTDLARLTAAMEAGAEFIVTPNIDDDVIRCCMAHDLLITPGGLTPTEITHAMAQGCKYVKLFPTTALGPAYLKSVLAPLSDACILAVGGISSGNFEAYLQAGAYGAGVGGNLCRMNTPEDAPAITAEAEALIRLRAQYVKQS